MGYLRPTAIIVGASYSASMDRPNERRHWIELAHEEALQVFERHGLTELVGEIVRGVVNNARSFFVAWDGSKEGWDESDRGDKARAEFVAWLRAQAYGDGSSPLDWVEVQYGGDDQEALVLAHVDEERVSA